MRIAEVVRRSSRGIRKSGQPCVLLVDVDDFKLINDGYGHAAGDEVLRLVARAMMASVRDTDIVARFGGDEFALLLEGVAREDDAMAIVERVHASVAHCGICLAGATVAVTCSVGVARLRDGTTERSADELLMAADTALYAAKSRGKNVVVVAEGARTPAEGSSAVRDSDPGDGPEGASVETEEALTRRRGPRRLRVASLAHCSKPASAGRPRP
jgi:diguanylate cyclase (GGDEF)-like protein